MLQFESRHVSLQFNTGAFGCPSHVSFKHAASVSVLGRMTCSIVHVRSGIERIWVQTVKRVVQRPFKFGPVQLIWTEFWACLISYELNFAPGSYNICLNTVQLLFDPFVHGQICPNSRPTHILSEVFIHVMCLFCDRKWHDNVLNTK